MCKKLILILILIIFYTPVSIAATQKARLEYNGYIYKFKPGDETKFLKSASKSMLAYETSNSNAEKTFYLQDAMKHYFLLSQIDAKSIDAQVGLGRVYDEMHMDKKAKEHFFMALNLDNLNPKTNFYFAKFYFKRNDFINSLNYFKNAYSNGYSKYYELNYLMGVTYEKLADVDMAQKFYVNALNLNPSNIDLRNKIYTLNSLIYSQPQYYQFQK